MCRYAHNVGRSQTSGEDLLVKKEKNKKQVATKGDLRELMWNLSNKRLSPMISEEKTEEMTWKIALACQKLA